MIYKSVWMVYTSTVCILVSIGLLSLTLSLEIASRGAKAVAMALSVIILMAGLYFSYRWNADKKEIQELGLRVAQAISKCLIIQQK